MKTHKERYLDGIVALMKLADTAYEVLHLITVIDSACGLKSASYVNNFISIYLVYNICYMHATIFLLK